MSGDESGGGRNRELLLLLVGEVRVLPRVVSGSLVSWELRVSSLV